MAIDPRRLLVLRAVRRCGGVLAAARLLHLTPSGVSQHLAKLEAEAGVPLVDRRRRGGGRSLHLTAAGHRLADSADRVADALAAAERDLAWFTQRPTGSLRVGGFSVALSELVAPVAMRMAVTDPALEPCIYEVDETSGLAALVSGELDLLLSEQTDQPLPPRPPGVVETDVLRDQFQVLVPRAWTVTADPAELLARTWVTTSFHHPTRQVLERLCREHGVELDARDIGTGSAPTLLALVANGLGATVIPGLTLRQNPSPNVRVSNGVLDPGARMITVLHAADNPAPAIPHFIAALRDFAAEQPDERQDERAR